MYNVWFDLCGIFLLSSILLSFYTRKNIPIRQNRLFALIAWLVLCSTSADFTTGVLQNITLTSSTVFPPVVYEFLNCFYFLTRNATPFIYLLYIIILLNLQGRFGTKEKLLILPFVAAVVLILTNPFFHSIFLINQNGFYQRGFLLPLLYLVAVLYMAFACGLCVYYRRIIPAPRLLALYSFAFIALITVLLQALFPTLLIEGFGSAMCVLLIYLTIQRPEEILDGPTGFLNKSAFATMLSIRFQHKTAFTVLFFLIDNLPFVERSYGMNITGNLMAEVASKLRKETRQDFYRAADDRLCLLLDRRDTFAAEALAGQLQKKLAESWTVGEFQIRLTARYGLIACPSDASDPEMVMEFLEAAAISHRHENGRRLRVDDPEITQKRRRQQLESVVTKAVENHALHVVYQPIYSVAEGRFTSAEALLRLQDPELGAVPPDEFIPIAEKSGAIVRMGQFVLDTACHFFSENHLEQFGVDYLEVNLSIMECLQDNIVESILFPLEKYGLDTGRINLEITESAASTLPETIHKNIAHLSGEGIGFSLDDYGTGYSNIARLLSLPFQMIKLDKSLIQEAFRSTEMKIVLESTFQMLQKLDKKILAEGVETEEQAKTLIEMGCDYIQGYYYSRPLPANKFLELLRVQAESALCVI